MGQLGWIDFSRTHRERVYAVIDFLQEKGTIDELGVGTIRNALADFFFPGINTIQTRAKYYFIIPRIIWEYQHQYANKADRPTLSGYLRKRENEIIRQLALKYQHSGENGIIGITLANAPPSKELARKPSTTYWNGLRAHDIIRTPLSLSEYLRWHDRPYQSIRDILEEDDRDAGYDDHYKIDLPDYAEGWSKDLSIRLSREEAAFLKDKMQAVRLKSGKHPANLLSQILSSPRRMEKLIRARNFNEMYELMREEKLLPYTIRMLDLAHAFNHIMEGAHIRYNLLVHHRFGSGEKVAEFRREWQTWLDAIFASGQLDRFEIDFLFKEAAYRTKGFTRRFVQAWYEVIKSGAADEEKIDRLVENQERQNKKGKARLSPGAEDALNGWVGLRWLNYRFPVAKAMINDIQKGLE